MQYILNKYEQLCNTTSDINEHLPTLKKYAEQSNFVVEMGVRGICSTWALLAGNPKKMISYDIAPPSKWGGSIEEVYNAVKETDIDFEFILQDVLTVKLENVDLLFIDTWHVYQQLIKELNLHCNGVNNYIILHDTTSFEFVGETHGHHGLWYAVEEFLANHREWELYERFINNNGLTVLRRIK